MGRKGMAEVKVETEIEVSARRKQHQSIIRRGSLAATVTPLTEAESKDDIIRRRKRAHQSKLKGGR